MAHVWKLIDMKRDAVASVAVVQMEILCEKVVVVAAFVERFVNKLGL
jgi:hypothetical protein